MTGASLSNASSCRQVANLRDRIIAQGSCVRTLISDPVRTWRDDVVQRLNELTSLPDGWDGYTGRPVSFETAYFALRLLEATCGSDAPVPQLVPGSDGDLQLEWHLGSSDIELHVRGPNDVTAWRAVDGAEVEFEELNLTNDFTTVVGWIRALSEPISDDASAAA